MLNPKFVSSHWLALKRKARNMVERADQKANQVKNFGVVQTQKHTGNSTTLKNNEAFPIKKHTPIDSHPSIWILVVSFLWKEISPGPLQVGKWVFGATEHKKHWKQSCCLETSSSNCPMHQADFYNYIHEYISFYMRRAPGIAWSECAELCAREEGSLPVILPSPFPLSCRLQTASGSLTAELPLLQDLLENPVLHPTLSPAPSMP